MVQGRTDQFLGDIGECIPPPMSNNLPLVLGLVAKSPLLVFIWITRTTEVCQFLGGLKQFWHSVLAECSGNQQAIELLTSALFFRCFWRYQDHNYMDPLLKELLQALGPQGTQHDYAKHSGELSDIQSIGFKSSVLQVCLKILLGQSAS